MQLFTILYTRAHTHTHMYMYTHTHTQVQTRCDADGRIERSAPVKREVTVAPRATVVPPALQFNESAFCLVQLQSIFTQLPELVCGGREEISEQNQDCWNGQAVGR